MTRSIIIRVLFLQLFCVNVFAQDNRDALDRELESLAIQMQLPGWSAIIVSPDKIVYQKSGGYANVSQKIPFDIYTIENIGSVSKTFIAVALMKAIEKGYFDLDTDINTVLPFKVINPFYPNLPVSIKDLVTHTSGIIDNDSIYHRSYRFMDTGNIDKTLLSFMNERGYSGGIGDTTLPQFMYSYLCKDGKLYSKKNFYNSKPGARSSYSNIGSALIAYLIEIRSGVSFAAFTEKYILKPLRMKQSGWFWDNKKAGRYAVPYFTKAVAFPFYSLITYPDGGLRTSASDLSKYVREMMHGMNAGSRLLNTNSIRTMFAGRFTPENMPENFSLQTRNKGVLWNIYNDGFIGHDGDDPGVSTNIMFNKDMGIIFMTNLYLEDRSAFLNLLKKYGAKWLEKE